MGKSNIAFPGIGYVGLTNEIANPEHGINTFCTDSRPWKVEKINQRIAPFFKPELVELLVKMIRKGLLRACAKGVTYYGIVWKK